MQLTLTASVQPLAQMPMLGAFIIMSKSGNCPYCSSPNCRLGISDFIGEKSGIKKVTTRDTELEAMKKLADHFMQHIDTYKTWPIEHTASTLLKLQKDLIAMETS